MSRASESSLCNIFYSHKYLVVSNITVHEADEFMPYGGVDQGVGYRHRVSVHWCCFVQVLEINAHA
jgi:hypothetical protein